jgi:uncharacterized membrane protein YqgA involved in biofilm formation
MWEIIMAVAAVLTLLGSLIGIWVNLNTRVTLLENNMSNLEKKQLSLIDEIKLTNQIIWKKLDNIDNKLDILNQLKIENEFIKNELYKYKEKR